MISLNVSEAKARFSSVVVGSADRIFAATARRPGRPCLYVSLYAF